MARIIGKLGIYPPLAYGYLGLLLMMIGDGVESGYLSPFLTQLGFSPAAVAAIFTAYGLTAAVAAWFSGALCDLWGPKRVMNLGLIIWVIFQAAFLLLGIVRTDYASIMVTYALRGFGYPLFAFGFLVWIAAATPAKQLGTAVGWFWFAFTGGLPTLGSLFASFTVPVIGPYTTLWAALVLVLAGGLVALLGTHEKTGLSPLAAKGEPVIRTLLSSVTIAWKRPRIGAGGIVRVINTAPQFGFLVFLPIYFTQKVGFPLTEWLRLLSAMFLSNIGWNLLFGVIGDRLGWRRTVALCGGVGSAITTLALYYTPEWFGANYPLCVLAAVCYGATLAGYVPLSALMPSMAPEQRGAAMSILNLGAGASVWVGPAIVGIFLPRVGVGGVMWIFAVLYLVSALLALLLKLPGEEQPVLGRAASLNPGD
ncbi:MAG: MFS transporter [Bryobacterales bacterium]|nr:MFS transporter [Bryobacterales bacterium]